MSIVDTFAKRAGYFPKSILESQEQKINTLEQNLETTQRSVETLRATKPRKSSSPSVVSGIKLLPSAPIGTTLFNYSNIKIADFLNAYHNNVYVYRCINAISHHVANIDLELLRVKNNKNGQYKKGHKKLVMIIQKCARHLLMSKLMKH